MKIAMLRVGIDTGSGGIHGPLFQDGLFEYLPIPDGFQVDPRTFSNMVGRTGKTLVDYFPASRRDKVKDQAVHVDPEFSTFTYGDPTPPKAGLRRLEKGDLLVFYCGLQGWDFQSEPALYLIGYFDVLAAGKASDFSPDEIKRIFGENFHVRHPSVYEQQKAHLVLVKGSDQSRLLTRAVRISEMGQDRAGRPLKVLSSEMQQIFGNFNQKISFQRCPTRWVDPAYVQEAAQFIRSLE